MKRHDKVNRKWADKPGKATVPAKAAYAAAEAGVALARAQSLPKTKRQHTEPGLVPPLIDLEVIERYGRLHLTIPQMAPLLDMSIMTVQDMLQRFPTVLRAYEHGLSRAIYAASNCLANAIDDGDVGTARYVLERKGGWEAPETPAVHVHSHVQTITVDSSHVTELGRRQAQLLGVAEPIDTDGARPRNRVNETA
jgi:hypothetical protein